ncbi:MAG: amidohydrolase family protein [Byssovorax sp.]
MALGSRWWLIVPSSAFLLAGCGQDATPKPNPFATTSSTSSSSDVGGAGGVGGQGGIGGQGGATTGASTATATTATTGGTTASSSASSSASSTSGATTGSSGSGGSGGMGPCDPVNPAVLIKKGDADKVLLKGTVVTPDTSFVGEVLVVGDTITCVGPSCSASPGAATASVVDTQGIIFPGLIDTHNHILFDIFNEDDWAPTQSYTNHNQWGASPRYKAMVDAKQWLNSEIDETVGGVVYSSDLGCELDKYGELKGLIAGTTSILTSATPGNKGCYASLSRTIDQTPNGLPTDKIQTATLFPSTSAADAVCVNQSSGKTDAYVIHIAEGIDATALKEFATLNTISTTDGCLLNPKTTIIHGAALGDAELTQMAASGMSLVWSPQSNVFLYGGGTVLTATANIPLAMSKGINVALGPDWSIGGSQNLLDELRFADKVDNTAWGNKITTQDLVKMVTINAAKALGLDTVLGSIAVGKKADLMIIGGDINQPYDALLAAKPADVRLVMVGGAVLYGDKVLEPIAQAAPACEDIDICCASKFVCVAAPGGTVANKLGQTLVEIESALNTNLTQFDSFNLTQWDFMPLAPLVKCQ